MKLLLRLLPFLLSVPALASTYTVGPTQSLASLQAVVNSANVGDTVQFAAGTYNLGATFQFKPGIHYTGPQTTPATAIIVNKTANQTVTSYPAGSAQTTIEYFDFSNAGGIYVASGASNIIIQHNQFSALPSGESCTACMAGVFFDGNINSTLSNITLLYNTFGDANSCTAVFAQANEQGGYCAGFLVNAGVVTNFSARYNTFVHVEEGIHFIQMVNFAVGATGAVCDSCDVQYNYFLNHHRIGAEIQVGVINHAFVFAHNIIQDPLNPYYGTYGASFACCQSGKIMGGVSDVAQALLAYDNVIISSVKGIATGPYGIEGWGNGSQFYNNVIQGAWCNGITWGYGSGAWAIYNNVIQGPTLVGPNAPGCGGYITNEEKTANAPAQSGNVVGSIPAAQTTAAPVIAQSNGTVTITTSGNSSAYYTTDGSTPTVSSALYTAPFTPGAGTTVKATAMWGVAPQPTTYPKGFGYVPSGVVSLAVAGGTAVTPPPPPPTLSSIAVAPNGTSVLAGSAAQQLVATGTYSSGPPQTITSSTTFSTTSAATVCTVSASGLFTPVGAGTCAIVAKDGSVTGTASIAIAAPAPTSTTLAPGNYSVTISASGITITKQQ
jgi:hypothetical protein